MVLFVLAVNKRLCTKFRTIIKKVVFESRAYHIYMIVEEGYYKRTLDIPRTLGLLLHTQV